MFKTAWKFSIYDKAKSIGVIVGILISTFLIGQQLGVFFSSPQAAGSTKFVVARPEKEIVPLIAGSVTVVVAVLRLSSILVTVKLLAKTASTELFKSWLK